MTAKARLAARVASLLGVDVVAAAPIQGGDLSVAHRLDLADGGTLIAKVGPHAATEGTMLEVIRAAGAPAPRVVACDGDLLVMERLDADGSLASAWEDLADALAALHGCRGDSYGWPVDYAFGPLAIPNSAADDWPGFWAERRLCCHLSHLPPPLARRIERLGRTLPDRLPPAPARSLLHGDLWGGNILVSGGAVTGLIDPACYHGDREVDLAMLHLFDRPPRRFVDIVAPEPGWRARQPVYRLWPLLVHLRLFGDGYRPAVEACLTELGE